MENFKKISEVAELMLGEMLVQKGQNSKFKSIEINGFDGGVSVKFDGTFNGILNALAHAINSLLQEDKEHTTEALFTMLQCMVKRLQKDDYLDCTRYKGEEGIKEAEELLKNLFSKGDE